MQRNNYVMSNEDNEVNSAHSQLKNEIKKLNASLKSSNNVQNKNCSSTKGYNGLGNS